MSFDTSQQKPYRSNFATVHSNMAKRNLGFEAQLKELEQIVERLEQGDISLEESLKLFEKGVQLARTCEQMLQQAEQKIQILVCHEDNTLQLKPFQIDDQPGSGTP